MDELTEGMTPSVLGAPGAPAGSVGDVAPLLPSLRAGGSVAPAAAGGLQRSGRPGDEFAAASRRIRRDTAATPRPDVDGIVTDEDAWTIATPGGGVLASHPAQPGEATEPRPGLSAE
jgi:hypothetical protein